MTIQSIVVLDEKGKEILYRNPSKKTFKENAADKLINTINANKYRFQANVIHSVRLSVSGTEVYIRKADGGRFYAFSTDQAVNDSDAIFKNIQAAFNSENSKTALEQIMKNPENAAEEHSFSSEVSYQNQNQNQNPKSSEGSLSKVQQVRKNVDEVKGIMQQNIEKVLKRGEKIDTTVEKTEKLKEDSVKFKNAATGLRKKMQKEAGETDPGCDSCKSIVPALVSVPIGTGVGTGVGTFITNTATHAILDPLAAVVGTTITLACGYGIKDWKKIGVAGVTSALIGVGMDIGAEYLTQTFGIPENIKPVVKSGITALGTSLCATVGFFAVKAMSAKCCPRHEQEEENQGLLNSVRNLPRLTLKNTSINV